MLLFLLYLLCCCNLWMFLFLFHSLCGSQVCKAHCDILLCCFKCIAPCHYLISADMSKLLPVHLTIFMISPDDQNTEPLSVTSKSTGNACKSFSANELPQWMCCLCDYFCINLFILFISNQIYVSVVSQRWYCQVGSFKRYQALGSRTSDIDRWTKIIWDGCYLSGLPILPYFFWY